MAFASMLSRSHPLRIVLPLIVFAAAVAAWEAVVHVRGIPPYILPAPSLVARTLVADWPLLSASLLTTLGTTITGLVLAVLGGVLLAILLSLSKIVEYSLYPFAVVLQVTPVIAIAPLLLIYMPQDAAVLACAWLVAFFPVLSNTMLGLQSVDRNLMELFELYGAPASQSAAARLKALWYLRRPAALPAFLAGLRIAGGLSLIGAVVAEMAAGSAGAGSGLAYRIIESQYRLNIPRLFAALVLLALTGIALFVVLAALNHVLLRRWHESALQREV
ncbi:ABC transporter permease [Microvirga sp. CF3016]|uniref:ABC transporter permease n=1 Tax=Microvirga sp. CF3016 TaxID=3110181 RepID=UPI002E7A3871|nr:ABC transporter permease subunit [Microvirga sp. CF3016]MEE1612861.1 ABC transporter permease subunit [Microvirga sp. CF3016]